MKRLEELKKEAAVRMNYASSEVVPEYEQAETILRLIAALERAMIQRNQIMYDHTKLNIEPELDAELENILEGV